MDYQFINISMAARKVAKKALERKKAGKKSGRAYWAIKNIIAEAARHPNACRHVIKPLPPKLIHGVVPDLLESVCNEKAEAAVNRVGKKIRVDTPVLLTIIVSFPREKANKDPKGYQKWVKDNLEFMRSEYGTQLMSVIEHLDEENPHLHCFVLPESGKAKDIHPGYLAEGDEKDPKTKLALYQAAMKNYQDRYWEMVGHPNGLSRIGTKPKKRVPRKEALAEKEAERLKSAALIDIDNMYKEAEARILNIMNGAEDKRLIELIRISELAKDASSIKPHKNSL